MLFPRYIIMHWFILHKYVALLSLPPNKLAIPHRCYYWLLVLRCRDTLHLFFSYSAYWKLIKCLGSVRNMLLLSLRGKMDEIITIFSYLGSNRRYKILLWKSLCTCISCMLAIYIAKAAQDLRRRFVQFKSSLSYELRV